MSATTSSGPGFGTNSWLVEEMYEQFREDPESVGEAWREFFADYRSTNPDAPAPAAAPDGATRSSAAPAPARRSRAGRSASVPAAGTRRAEPRRRADAGG